MGEGELKFLFVTVIRVRRNTGEAEGANSRSRANARSEFNYRPFARCAFFRSDSQSSRADGNTNECIFLYAGNRSQIIPRRDREKGELERENERDRDFSFSRDWLAAAAVPRARMYPLQRGQKWNWREKKRPCYFQRQGCTYGRCAHAIITIPEVHCTASRAARGSPREMPFSP